MPPPRFRARSALRPELVGGVEGRDLVALGERRVVEDGVEEVVEPPAQTEHGLADVNELGGPGADRVDAEQPTRLTMEEELHQPRIIADDLSACDLAIARDAGLVRNPGS